MEKQTIQFNGQEWEEITRLEYIAERKDFLLICLNDKDFHYYRLIPKPETFPKIFGAYKVEQDGQIGFSDMSESHYWVTFLMDTEFNNFNLKLALEESERIRSKQ